MTSPGCSPSTLIRPASFSTALVIDDDPLFRMIAEDTLRAAGIQSVIVAGDGREAMVQLDTASGPVDLIMCDLQMPTMNGVDVVRELSARRYDGALLIVSSEDNSLRRTVHSMARKLGIGIIGEMSKPLDIAQLGAILAAARIEPAKNDPELVTHEEATAALASGQLVPYYQPKIDLQSQRIAGFEVLVRLVDNAPTASAPASYLEAIAANGLCLDLICSLIHQAARDTANWSTRLGDFKLSFNLSPDCVKHPDTAGVLADAVKAAGLLPQNVTFEVTEERLLQNTAQTLESLSQLRLHGFGLSIDDFGSGATSIEQIRLFPFTELKIDRQFLSSPGQDDFSRLAVETSIKLAALAGMRVVAEGVENLETLAFAHRMGADEVQGYYFARPLSGDVARSWLDEFQQVALG